MIHKIFTFIFKVILSPYYQSKRNSILDKIELEQIKHHLIEKNLVAQDNNKNHYITYKTAISLIPFIRQKREEKENKQFSSGYLLLFVFIIANSIYYCLNIEFFWFYYLLLTLVFFLLIFGIILMLMEYIMRPFKSYKITQDSIKKYESNFSIFNEIEDLENYNNLLDCIKSNSIYIPQILHHQKIYSINTEEIETKIKEIIKPLGFDELNHFIYVFDQLNLGEKFILITNILIERKEKDKLFSVLIFISKVFSQFDNKDRKQGEEEAKLYKPEKFL